MRNIVDIYRDVIASLATSITVTDVTDNGGGTWTLEMDDTKWLRPSPQKSLVTVVDISGTDYIIESMVRDQSITIRTTDDLSAVESVGVAAPVYVNGTELAVNQERKAEQFAWNQTPFVWLVEPFVAPENVDRMKVVATTPDLVMLFLDNQNLTDWSTADHYEKVINPMREIIEAFQSKILSMAYRPTFQRILNWRTINHVKFGREFKEGHKHTIIDEATSGIEVRFTVEILKQCDC
jgi:hypothetical protein